ncbi:MAG: biotin--[acetyl-CoA-carboxylase] ligase [Proteobacteria bacterium]|nr:biotin--[acetyl-CoA-carboxylase] ligase [Pseudomonadota bacterium]
MAHEIPSTTFKIVDILNDCKLHTGTNIAETLGISRTAVWKVVQRLKQYNIHIESQHQGYYFNSPLLLIDKKRIKNSLKDPRITLEIFESIPSTCDYLKKKASLKNLNFCFAEHQSKGRGRLGRSWISPFGKNIYCSFSYTFNKDISEMSGLSLVIGILVARALESLNPILKPLLKWPNDIYIDDQKGGGILIDLIAEAHGNCTAIISIGLNVNMKDVKLEGIDQPWTSLEHILNEKIDRNVVITQMLKSILKGMEVFQWEGIEPFLSEWKQYDLLKDEKISLNTGTEVISGIAKGISPQGHLLLELPSGKIEKFSYGDTTLFLKGIRCP